VLTGARARCARGFGSAGGAVRAVTPAAAKKHGMH
jgi:hypothetical protein